VDSHNLVPTAEGEAMRVLVAFLFGALMLGTGDAEAHGRSRSGSSVIAPPGSTVIIIPPADNHHRWNNDRFNQRLFERRHSPSFGGSGWTTPGFSSGFTTPGFGSSTPMWNRGFGDTRWRR